MTSLPWICDKGLLVSASFTSSISHKFSIIGSKSLGIWGTYVIPGGAVIIPEAIGAKVNGQAIVVGHHGIADVVWIWCAYLTPCTAIVLPEAIGSSKITHKIAIIGSKPFGISRDVDPGHKGITTFITGFHSRSNRQSNTPIKRSRLSPRFYRKAMELETVFVIFPLLLI